MDALIKPLRAAKPQDAKSHDALEAGVEPKAADARLTELDPAEFQVAPIRPDAPRPELEYPRFPRGTLGRRMAGGPPYARHSFRERQACGKPAIAREPFPGVAVAGQAGA